MQGSPRSPGRRSRGAGSTLDEAATPPMYRVRIGPIRGVDDYDALVAKLEALGISDPYLVAL